MSEASPGAGERGRRGGSGDTHPRVACKFRREIVLYPKLQQRLAAVCIEQRFTVCGRGLRKRGSVFCSAAALTPGARRIDFYRQDRSTASTSYIDPPWVILSRRTPTRWVMCNFRQPAPSTNIAHPHCHFNNVGSASESHAFSTMRYILRVSIEDAVTSYRRGLFSPLAAYRSGGRS